MTSYSQLGQYFTSADYLLALPILLLAVFGVGVLLIDLMLPPEWKRLNAITALLGLAFAAVAVLKIHAQFRMAEAAGLDVTHYSGFFGTVMMDRFAVYFFYLFLAGAAVAVLSSVKYLQVEREDHGEFYALVLFATIGMMTMACGYDLILLYIGLETMAIPTYVMVGFLRSQRRSNEAALKYMLLGAFSSGIFAYGLSLFYGLSGSTNLGEIATALQQRIAADPRDPVVIFALVTTVSGLLFKIAAVPFHQWAPDAYEGAPTNVTGFMSVSVKAAAWALLLRMFIFGLAPLRELYVPMIVFVAVATLTGGNLAAMTQTNTKRLLAYSSIAHVGYMLLGLVASDNISNQTGIKGILMYLLVYTFMNLGAFAVLTSLRRRDIVGDELDDIAGLHKKAPTEAVLMLIFLLSLAGIPPLAGFWGKYFIFLSLIETGHYILATIAVFYAVVSVYYYLKIANAMFVREGTTDVPVQSSLGLRTALLITGTATVLIGLFPSFFIRAVDWSLISARAASIALMR